MPTETRLRQVPGGWLLARDLRDQPRLQDLHLAHHHVVAHRTWGCSTGLRVMLAGDELVVTPGAAVDRCGRTVVLSETFSARLTTSAATGTVVALRLRGHGPDGRVVLRTGARAQELDVPLARIDDTGVVRAGDGDRQWLRRPGPARRLGGIVPRGQPASGTYSEWAAHVDLGHHLLEDVPVAFASPAGHTPAAARTTVEVMAVSATGLDLVVRNHVPVGDVALGDVVETTPLALSWLVLLPAERPELPPLEWT
ncbi:hypothetical protein ASC64_18850 [Nocardioides sp. Root122]|uniref:hypothetical protein n=1 Tax=Nocardioides TaxID=1839 RepID=UPI0007026D54|nr:MULTISPECIES: hypothetical protein [Nocardioides]KQV73496.1 hypothetical protein ASC64_18850 [Nocardioides sp. Root122]MCK9825242.1 hypothetical protein [Nocardioides cavernae]